MSTGLRGDEWEEDEGYPIGGHWKRRTYLALPTVPLFFEIRAPEKRARAKICLDLSSVGEGKKRFQGGRQIARSLIIN